MELDLIVSYWFTPFLDLDLIVLSQLFDSHSFVALYLNRCNVVKSMRWVLSSPFFHHPAHHSHEFFVIFHILLLNAIATLLTMFPLMLEGFTYALSTLIFSISFSLLGTFHFLLTLWPFDLLHFFFGCCLCLD